MPINALSTNGLIPLGQPRQDSVPVLTNKISPNNLIPLGHPQQDSIPLVTAVPHLMSGNVVSSQPRQDGVPGFSSGLTVLSSNVVSSRPRQDTVPGFKYIFSETATSLTTAAAGIGTAALNQTKNTFTAVPLASQSSPGAVPLFIYNSAFLSIVNYTNTSPLLDSVRPSLTLTSAFNIVANSLTSGAAGLGQPVIQQTQVFSAISIASRADSVPQSQFVQFQALTANNLAAGGAGLGTPGIGNIYVLLTPQLNFANVDSVINQLNAALLGISATASLGTIANTVMMVNSLYSASGILAVSIGIGIANRAAMASAAALTVQENLRLINSSSIAISSVLRANAPVFYFDTSEMLASTSSIQVAATSILLKANAVASPLSSSIIKETTLKAALINLAATTSLSANVVDITATLWQGSTTLSPVSTLAGFMYQNQAGYASLSSTFNSVANVLLYETALSMSPSATLASLMTSQMMAALTASPVALMAVTESVIYHSNSSISPSSVLGAQLLLPRNLGSGLSPQVIVSSVGTLRIQSVDTLLTTASMVVSETQRLSSGMSLIPSLNFNVASHTLYLPTASWKPQTAIFVNERVLPFGTAFYFAQIGFGISLRQLMAATSPFQLQSQLTPREGLRLIQSPLVMQSSTTMTTLNEYFLIGPNLKLVSNIVVNIDLISLSAAYSRFPVSTGLSIQYALDESIAASLKNTSNMNTSTTMKASGLATLSPACYISPDVSIKRCVEISATIIGQKSRSRIVAKGSLVREFE